MQGKTSATYDRLITFVQDRPGHDLRYSLNGQKLETQLGWTPIEPFDLGLEKTIRWYMETADDSK